MSENVAFALPAGYMGEYVSNIPWEKNPAFAFSNDADGYLKAFRNVIEMIPEGDMKIRFEDDLWDFRPYFKRNNSTSYVLHFEKYPAEIKDYAKFFVLFLIAGNSKISTANVRLQNCLSVINMVLEETGQTTIFTITSEQVIDAIDGEPRSAQTKYNLLFSVCRFFSFLENNYHMKTALDMDIIKSKTQKEKRIRDNMRAENKLPNIPEEYFQDIRNMAIRIMRDDAAEYNSRATAALLVILTDTGLRIGDLLALDIHALRTKNLSICHAVEFIHYSSEKPTPAHSELLEFDIFCTAICAEAFRLLLDIRKGFEFASDSDFLYVLNRTTHSDDSLPIKHDRFYRIYRSLVEVNLADDCTHDWGEAISPSSGKLYPTVYIPKTEQFRVHLCSYLYNEKHLPLVWIQRYMGHLSEAMLGYYVRPKNTYQEDVQRFGEVIKEIHNDHIRLLGGDDNGTEIAKRINEFLEIHKINAKTNVQSIADAVGENIIIRAKTGGVCIKTSLMPCSRDARSDELMCAYDLCPNLFHFYYMADISYGNFITMQQTVKINQDNGHTRAAQKELNKLQNYLMRRLIPELDELDAEIQKNGVKTIIDRYPSLIDIISREDAIRKEIQTWQNMKIHE